jgi:hypothetical protein
MKNNTNDAKKYIKQYELQKEQIGTKCWLRFVSHYHFILFAHPCGRNNLIMSLKTKSGANGMAPTSSMYELTGISFELQKGGRELFFLSLDTTPTGAENLRGGLHAAPVTGNDSVVAAPSLAFWRLHCVLGRVAGLVAILIRSKWVLIFFFHVCDRPYRVITLIPRVHECQNCGNS